MQSEKAHIIKNLKEHILSLQGFKRPKDNSKQISLGPIDNSFPGNYFPLSVTHEFLVDSEEGFSATSGFICHIISELMKRNGICFWINSCANIFPPALKYFGIDPDKIIFVNLQKQKDILWVIEEALKCEGLAGVVGEIQDLSFTDSRRFQLAVEKSNVTGFILRHSTKNLSTTACVTRWRITSLQSDLSNGIPGVGFPKWNVELLKVRNGQPGQWDVEWREGRFQFLSKALLQDHLLLEKTG